MLPVTEICRFGNQHVRQTIYCGWDKLQEHSHWQTHFVERLLHFICPCKRSFLFQTKLNRQRFYDMCATWPHVTIMIHAANEYVQFCGVAWAIHMEYGISLLFPGL